MYQLGIWMIVLALVFNGAPTLALNDGSGVPTVAAHSLHDEAAEVECNTQAGHVAVSAEACQVQRAAHDHLNCCWICNVVAVLPGVFAAPVKFSYATVTFHTAQFDLVGHPVALDPDIPKIVV